MTRIEVASRAPIAGSFGAAGAYELISGKFYGELDPKDAKNAIIKAFSGKFTGLIISDDVDKIRAQVRKWIEDPKVEAVITTGGTGVTGRDVTPEALEALFEKKIEGFGETFRWISFQKIGTSTMQSRATAGVANGTYIFALPGSTGACKDGWDDILRQQLDIRFRPCNFAELMPRLNEGKMPRSG